MTARQTLGIFLLLTVAGPEADVALAQGPSAAADAVAAVVIRMEGETHVLRDIDWTQSTVTLEAGEIRFYFAEAGNPVTLNFNLSNTDLLESGAGVYTLPEANAGNAAIDLNFFNRNRASSRMQRRIVFDQGTIDIEVLSRDQLKLTFDGSGHPLMDPARFRIEGSISVTF